MISSHLRALRLITVSVVAFAALIGSSAAVAASSGSAIHVVAQLNATQEVPTPTRIVKTASGKFTATLVQTKKGYQLEWSVTFSKLSGQAASLYIHQGARGKYGAALFYLCAPCKVGSHGSQYASPSEVTLMLTGRAYVNLRTRKNPSGEIRGEIAKAS